MLILQSALRNPDGLAFSPDGNSLLAVGGNTVQVWPRWLDGPPRRPKRVQASLERYAFSPDAARVYLYVSGNSHTRVLDVAGGEERDTALPSGGPSWFHFTAAGGYFVCSHDRGKLVRFDYAPKAKDRVRKAWAIERPAAPLEKGDAPTALGSHYRFGAICGPAGTFVALEYRYGGREPLDGLTVRTTTDGDLIRREPLDDKDGRALLADAGLTLSIHPSGAYFAYPKDKHVRLRPLARKPKVPGELPVPSGAACRAVAFHPSGALLAATAGPAVVLYDTATWQVARTLEWQVGELRAVCFTQDGTRGAAVGAGESRGRGKSSGGRVVVWDVDV